MALLHDSLPRLTAAERVLEAAVLRRIHADKLPALLDWQHRLNREVTAVSGYAPIPSQVEIPSSSSESSITSAGSL